jgi:hypothetical protein
VTGNTLYLDQYTAGGTYVNTTQIPDQGTGLPYGTGGTNTASLPFGSPALIFAGAGGDSALGAFLTRSTDGQTINFAGYCEAYPFGGTDLTVGANGGANWRGIAGVNAFGLYNIPYTNTGLYSLGGHQIHGAVTFDQTNFWTTGEAGSVGLKILNINFQPANGAGLVGLSGSSAGGTRVVRIINGNLVYSDVGGASPGIYACAGAVGATPSSLLVTETNSPTDFAISPDGGTIYIADNSTFVNSSTQGGGIERWDADTINGGYAYSYTLGTGAGSVAGARGLTVDFSAHATWGVGVTGAKLYATTAETTANRLIKITDNGSGSAASNLAAVGPGNTLAGVEFGPVAVPVSIASQPQSQAALVGGSATFSAVATGSKPITYQWYFQTNGTGPYGAINLATNTTYTVNNAGSGNVGNYFVVAQNPVPSSAQSDTVALTLAASPSFGSVVNLGPGNGYQLNFSGPAGFGYSIWTSTDVTLRPIPNTWTKISTGTFSGGADSFTDATGGTNPQQFYVISVP